MENYITKSNVSVNKINFFRIMSPLQCITSVCLKLIDEPNVKQASDEIQCKISLFIENQ